MALKLNLSAWQKKWMGKYVEYTSVLQRVVVKDKASGKDYASWETRELDCPKRGMVVGLRWLLTGFITHSWTARSLFEEPESEQGYLTENKPRTLCYLIVPYPTRNYIRVPPWAVTLLEEQNGT